MLRVAWMDRLWNYGRRGHAERAAVIGKVRRHDQAVFSVELILKEIAAGRWYGDSDPVRAFLGNAAIPLASRQAVLQVLERRSVVDRPEDRPAHLRSRREVVRGSPARFPVPDGTTWANVHLLNPTYDPPYFDAAHPDAVRPSPEEMALWGRHPVGPTGLTGPGRLRHLDENLGVAALVTRLHPMTGRWQVLMVEKKSGGWNIPAGFVEDGEEPVNALSRELWEEVGLSISADEIRACLIGYKGVVDSPRATDNAWEVVEARHIHLWPETADTFVPTPTDTGEILQAAWVDADKKEEKKFPRLPGYFIERLMAPQHDHPITASAENGLSFDGLMSGIVGSFRSMAGAIRSQGNRILRSRASRSAA